MIERDEGRMQICCDTCPASYPNTYAAEDFAAMVADAKVAGWTIRKAPAGRDRDTAELFGSAPKIAGPKGKPEPYIHACPTCAAGPPSEGSLL